MQNMQPILKFKVRIAAIRLIYCVLVKAAVLPLECIRMLKKTLKSGYFIIDFPQFTTGRLEIKHLSSL